MSSVVSPIGAASPTALGIRARRQAPAVGEQGHVVARSDAAQGDQGHVMDGAHVLQGPGEDVGEGGQVVRRDGDVEPAADAPDAGHEIGQGLPEAVQLGLGLALPARPVLAGVDMEIEFHEAGPGQVQGHGSIEPQSVRQEERFHSAGRDVPDDVREMRVGQRLAAGDLHVVAIGRRPAGIDVGQDVDQGTMPLAGNPVA